MAVPNKQAPFCLWSGIYHYYTFQYLTFSMPFDKSNYAHISIKYSTHVLLFGYSFSPKGGTCLPRNMY